MRTPTRTHTCPFARTFARTQACPHARTHARTHNRVHTGLMHADVQGLVQGDLEPFDDMLASLSAAIRRTDIFKPQWAMEFQDLALKLDVRVEQERKRRAKEEEKFEKKRNEERAALQKEQQEAIERREQQERESLQRQQVQLQAHVAAATAASQAQLAEQQQRLDAQRRQHELLEQELLQQQRLQQQRLQQERQWSAQGSIDHAAAVEDDDKEDDIDLLTDLLLGAAPVHDVGAVPAPAPPQTGDFAQRTTLQSAIDSEDAAFHANMNNPFQQIDLGAPPGVRERARSCVRGIRPHEMCRCK